MLHEDEDTSPGMIKSTEYPSDDCSNSAACIDGPNELLVVMKLFPLHVAPESDEVR
jgi:hypothetical protein